MFYDFVFDLVLWYYSWIEKWGSYDFVIGEAMILLLEGVYDFDILKRYGFMIQRVIIDLWFGRV